MKNNEMRVTPYKIDYSVEIDNGEMDRYIRCFDSESELFHFASSLYAFDDLVPVEVHSIKSKGANCRYIGWQPGMVFTFVNTRTGKVVYEGEFPEWDH